MKYETTHQKYLDFIDEYARASNAATGSKVDANANVEQKNIATLAGELHKKDNIKINRLLMQRKITDMFGENLANEYVRQLEAHEIYRHDETSIFPYTYSSQESIVVKRGDSVSVVSFEDLYNMIDAEEDLLNVQDEVTCKYPSELLVLDKNGWTPIQRVIKKRLHRPMVAVKTRYGENVIVTDNHPMIVCEDQNDVVPARESASFRQYRSNSVCNVDIPVITEEHWLLDAEDYGSYIAYHQPNVNNHALHSVKLTRDFGFAVGFFCAEGWYAKHDGENCTIRYITKDRNILKYCASAIYEATGVYGHIYGKTSDRGMYILDYTNKLLVSLFTDVFKIKSGAPNKTIPEKILSYPEEFQLGFLSGLIEGDGTVTNNIACIRLTSRTAISQLSYLLRKCGYGGSMTYGDFTTNSTHYIKGNYPIFGIAFALDERIQCSKRKDRARERRQYVFYEPDIWSPVYKVEYVENAAYLNKDDFIYDVTTQSGTFILNNIWVHNCVSITMYPFLFKGMGSIGGCSKAPTHLNSFAGNFVNLVFAVASQFAGACSTPEFLLYLDYFIRKEYGDDYYLHADKIVDGSSRHRTIYKVITDVFEQIVYSLNQPAAARGFQSVFWNVAYYDHLYFDGMFGDFIFPDGTKPIWESLSWLQKTFMKWFNKERLRAPLTFPVETLNLLDDGEKYVDEEWANFAAEMWSEGHSFFLYRSDSVDSLSSCCFAPETKILAKSSSNVFLMPIGELHNMKFNGNKENLCVYHNGSWVKAKTIRLPATDMYKIKTSNEKSVVATGNHLFPTLRGDVRVDQLRTDDYILFNTMALDSFPEKDDFLTYEQGFLIGMYLGDGSIDAHGPCQQTVNFSINENKYNSCIDKMNKALADMSIEGSFTLGKPINNVYPVRFYGNALAIIIRKYVTGNYANEKRLDASVYLQSKEFRHGIIDGLYATDGGNNNRIYSTSKGLIEDIECLCSTLGLNTIVDVSDRTDEPVIIRGKSYTRNYPLYCLRWYEPKNKRTMGDIFKIVNNGMYFRVSEVSPIDDYAHDFVYCFEVANTDEPYFTLPNGMISHNCRLRNELQDNTFSYTLGAGGVSTGSKAVITMNINRLVQNAVRDGKDISEAVREQTRKIHKYLMAYNEIVRNFFNSRMLPVYDAGFISMEKQYLTIGINGFVEGAEFLGIKPCPNDQYFAYGEMILKPIYEENKKARTKELMFNTEFVPSL